MTSDGKGKRFLSLLWALSVLFLGFFLIARPWLRQWGATDDEARKTLPGDEITPFATSQETRAITIDAGVDRVWPWLAQLGQDRGGFYSYDLLENLVGCRMPTTDVLRPDKQTWHLGDKLWMYPKEKGGGVGFATLRSYVPGRALGFGGREMGAPPAAPESGSWSMILEPVDAGTTRLLTRGREMPGRSLIATVFNRVVFEPAHFVMERRMMISLKQLAEGSDRGRVWNHVQILLWTATFVLFVLAGIQVMISLRWRRWLVVFLSAGITFQVLTLLQPSAFLGALTLAAAAVIPWKLPSPRVSKEARPFASGRPAHA